VVVDLSGSEWEVMCRVRPAFLRSSDQLWPSENRTWPFWNYLP